jgi:hypothetical protein
MKMKTLLVLAGVCTPLIATASTAAGFVGIKVVKKIPNEFGITTINVYAEFDNMGNDRLEACAGLPNAPMTIGVIDGTFWNRQFGGDTAPSGPLADFFPSLAFDSFYTIGLKFTTPPIPDATTLVNLPTLGSAPGNTVTEVSSSSASWAAVPPTAPQTDPWDPSTGPPGQVLLGQFSTTNGTGFYGTFLIQFVVDGQNTDQEVVSFQWFAPPPPCPWDCADPPNGQVGIPDFLALLAQWHTSGSCDFDGGDVHISDFLAMLAHWGPCP